MKGEKLIEALRSPSADRLFSRLYGETKAPRERYLALAEGALRAFPEAKEELRVFTAAGRTELGGNHTDHNNGRVLAAAIQLDAVAFVSPRADTIVLFRSSGYPDVKLDISDTQPRSQERGTTEALVRGIADEFARRGIRLGGFSANAASTVLRGSGLSSSAAVEVLIAAIFNGLYAAPRQALPPMELAKIGQKAENLFFGKPCGLMDQMASAVGGAVAIDFENPEAPELTSVDFSLGSSGYALCVLDSGGDHADLTPDYAAIPAEMKAVAARFDRGVLRGLTRAELINKLPSLREELGDRAILRALHFFDENDRVVLMVAALREAAQAESAGKREAGDAAIERYLSEVDASGRSSWEYLQNIATPRREKEQGVALGLALSRVFFQTHPAMAQAGKRGVCRVHGGGFAGTIQAYLPAIAVKAYQETLGSVFGPSSVTPLRVRPIGAAELFFDDEKGQFGRPNADIDEGRP